MGKPRIIAVPAALALALMGLTDAPGSRQPVIRTPGDFNGDGFADLAMGVPFENVGRRPDAGGVNVVYGSATGLTAAGNQFWTQDSPGVVDSAETNDQFGFALATGDFNGDGFEDLAVGVPEEDVGSKEHAGGVSVIYGSATGLTATGNQFWSQDSPGIVGKSREGDTFGRALATGDFDHDSFADLAAGVPFRDLRKRPDAGGVSVIYGSPAGLAADGNQFWSQDSAGIVGAPETGDTFGLALVAADFDGDTHADLAIGVPGEDLPLDAGGVNVIYGSATGLVPARNRFWDQDRPGIEGSREPFDLFGYSLSGGDFDQDGFADLAVGVPFEDIGKKFNAGAVGVIHGSAGGLGSARNQLWSQDSPRIVNGSEARDEFGFALAGEDFNGDGFDDLAIGVPGEDPPANAGSAAAIYGGPSGLSSSGNQLWSQDQLSGSSGEVWDGFGFSLAAGRFGNGTPADLAVTVPFEDVRTDVNVGAVNVVYGSPAGLVADGNQLWTQDDLAGSSERGDQFGYGAGRPGG